MTKDIEVTLTPREQHRLASIAYCRRRIERKIVADPRSVRVKGWKVRLDEARIERPRIHLDVDVGRQAMLDTVVVGVVDGT